MKLKRRRKKLTPDEKELLRRLAEHLDRSQRILEKISSKPHRYFLGEDGEDLDRLLEKGEKDINTMIDTLIRSHPEGVYRKFEEDGLTGLQGEAKTNMLARLWEGAISRWGVAPMSRFLTDLAECFDLSETVFASLEEAFLETSPVGTAISELYGVTKRMLSRAARRAKKAGA